MVTQALKKRFIAALLFVSCITGGWLFTLSPAGPSSHLQNLGQADSLLQLTFSDFNIIQNQITTRATRIDSNFERKSYTISVAPGFSKTQFHSVLKNRLAPYHILLPARVIFPDEDMHIYINYRNTIVRTIKLITDEDRSAQHSGGINFNEERAHLTFPHPTFGRQARARTQPLAHIMGSKAPLRRIRAELTIFIKERPSLVPPSKTRS